MSIIRLLPLLTLLLLWPVSAWTFHGDVQRTGNFSDIGPKASELIHKIKVGGLVDSSPVVWNGNVYVISWFGKWYGEKSYLICVNATNGTIIWRKELEGASTPTIYNNKLFVGTLSGTLYCINASTGEIIWNKTLEKNPSWYGIASSPLIYNDTLYVTTFSTGTLYALDLDGNEKWNITTGGMIGYYTSPSAYNGRIFFAGNKSGINMLICVNENGTELWNFTVNSTIISSPVIANGIVYFVTINKLYAVAVVNGKEVWNISINGTISTPALAFGKLYVGTKDGKLLCLNATDGEVIWEFQANGPISSSPAVADNVVYFATNVKNGTIYALNATTGELIWKYELKPPENKYYNIMSSPFIWNGKLFIGADDGNLYIIGLWRGMVTLKPGTFNVTVEGKTYEVSNLTILGALNEASKIGGFNYTLKCYDGGLYPLSIGDIDGIWCYNVNGSMVQSDLRYNVSNGDTIVFWLWKKGVDANNSPNEVIIHVRTKTIEINDANVSDGKRGENATAWINLTCFKDGWYVIVVSGVNKDGDSIVGVSVVKLRFGERLSVPVIIPIPQQVRTGIYNLITGVYKLNEYPNNLITWKVCGNCTVR